MSERGIQWSVGELNTALKSDAVLDNDYSRFLMAGALRRIQELEKAKTQVDERLAWAETDNDNHWKFRARMSTQLEAAISVLKDMRRKTGEDS